MSQTETKTPDVVETPDIAEMPETNSFYSGLPSKFSFSSGAGGWMTVMELNDDGSFTGSF